MVGADGFTGGDQASEGHAKSASPGTGPVEQHCLDAMRKIYTNGMLAALLNGNDSQRLASELVGQLKPPRQFVILVPCPLYRLQTATEDERAIVVASHIVRIGKACKAACSSDSGAQSAAYTFSTLNGKSILVKNDVVSTLRGFKKPTSTKILYDRLIYTSDMSVVFVAYYIDRPLERVERTEPVSTSFAKMESKEIFISSDPSDKLMHLLALNTKLYHDLKPKIELLLQDCNELLQKEENVEIPVMKRQTDYLISSIMNLFRVINPEVLRNCAVAAKIDGDGFSAIIEEYVTNQLYDLIFFRICKQYNDVDLKFSESVLTMIDIGVHQVGLPSVDQEILRRLLLAIPRFRDFGSVRSPIGKLKTLVSVIRLLSSGIENATQSITMQEKESDTLLNSDYLVPLLVIVVLRANVINLHSSLAYVRNFASINLEHGEAGFAISNLEAVLYYLSKSGNRLATISGLDRKLWTAVENNDIQIMRTVLEPSNSLVPSQDEKSALERNYSSTETQLVPENVYSAHGIYCSKDGNGISSVARAVIAQHSEVLHYLLGFERERYFIIEDQDNDGRTIISHAMKTGNSDIIRTLLSFASSLSVEVTKKWVNRQDYEARSVGHLLHYQPSLIGRFAGLINWTLKDKNGLTPLSSLCRCYDIFDYDGILKQAVAACKLQNDGFDFDAHINNQGNTLLHIVGSADGIALISTFDKVDFNRRNRKGLTPLLHWGRQGKLLAIECMLNDSRCNPLVRDNRGMSLLHLSILRNQYAVFLLAVKHIDINVQSTQFGWTPLMLAVRERKNKILNYLLENLKPNTEICDFFGFKARNMTTDENIMAKLDASSLFLRPKIHDRCFAVIDAYITPDRTLFFILMTGVANDQSSNVKSIRSLADFHFLWNWLHYEYPESWLPVLPNNDICPQGLISTPSICALRYLEARMEIFLNVLLHHPTFSKHELLWEFFMVNKLDKQMIEIRSRNKNTQGRFSYNEHVSTKTNTEDIASFLYSAKHSILSRYSAYNDIIRLNRLLIQSSSFFDEALLDLQTRLRTLLGKECTYPIGYMLQVCCNGVDVSSYVANPFFEPLIQLPGILLSLERSISLKNEFLSLTENPSQHSISAITKIRTWPMELIGNKLSKKDKKEDIHTDKDGFHATEQKLLSDLCFSQLVIANELSHFSSLHSSKIMQNLKTWVKCQIKNEKHRLLEYQENLAWMRMHGVLY